MSENENVLTEAQKDLVAKVKARAWLTETEELLLFDLPVSVRKDTLFIYLRRCPLCDAAKLRFFNLPEEEIKELILVYEPRTPGFGMW